MSYKTKRPFAALTAKGPTKTGLTNHSQWRNHQPRQPFSRENLHPTGEHDKELRLRISIKCEQGVPRTGKPIHIGILLAQIIPGLNLEPRKEVAQRQSK